MKKRRGAGCGRIVAADADVILAAFLASPGIRTYPLSAGDTRYWSVQIQMRDSYQPGPWRSYAVVVGPDKAAMLLLAHHCQRTVDGDSPALAALKGVIWHSARWPSAVRIRDALTVLADELALDGDLVGRGLLHLLAGDCGSCEGAGCTACHGHGTALGGLWPELIDALQEICKRDNSAEQSH